MITEESLQESLQKFDEKMADLTQRFGDLEDEMLRHKDVKQEKQADDVNLDASKQHNALKSNVPLAALCWSFGVIILPHVPPELGQITSDTNGGS